jgi:hypothetical protein
MRARPFHRIRQGLMRLRAGLHPDRIDVRSAQGVLSREEWRLFTALSPGDQAHALCVLSHARQRPGVTHALAVAALLHDLGKLGAGQSLGWRAWIVVLRAVGLEERVALAEPGSWRHAVHVQLHHAERGASMCERIGSSPRTVALIRWHDTALIDVPDLALRDELGLLQASDEAC